MGKKQRLAQKRREEARKQAEEEATGKIESRRSFLKKSLGVAGLLFVGGAVASSLLFEEEDRPQSENFSFIYRSHDFEGYVIPQNVFDAQCVRIGIAHPADGNEVVIAQTNLEPIIREEMARRCLTADYNVAVSKQYYGKTFDGVEVDDAMRYSSELLEFMKSKVSGLDTVGVSFRKLRRGVDWTRDYDRKVFFGDYYIISLIAEVKNGSALIMDPYSTRQAAPHAMSCVTPDVASFAFIPATEMALSGIPSEIIPWTTLPCSLECLEHLGIDEVIKADEGIAEGMSQIISLEFGKIKGVPAIEQRLDKQIDGMSTPKYGYVRDSIKWLQNNGVQAGFDLYMENPQKYIDAIAQD